MTKTAKALRWIEQHGGANAKYGDAKKLFTPGVFYGALSIFRRRPNTSVALKYHTAQAAKTLTLVPTLRELREEEAKQALRIKHVEEAEQSALDPLLKALKALDQHGFKTNVTETTTWVVRIEKATEVK